MNPDMLNFLNGMKTFVGGAILIGGGAAGMYFGVVDPVTGVTMIGSGFTAWGIGSKLEKIVQSSKQPTFGTPGTVPIEKEPTFNAKP